MFKSSLFIFLVFLSLSATAQFPGPKASAKAKAALLNATTATVLQTTARPGFPNVISYRLYSKPHLALANIRGLVILCSYTKNLIDEPLLNNIGKLLDTANYLVAVINTRADNTLDNIAQFATLDSDFQNVFETISSAYSIPIENTVLGGISFSGFGLSYNFNRSLWFKGCRGLAILCSGTYPSIPVHIINVVCKGDHQSNNHATDADGNYAGIDLREEMIVENPENSKHSYFQEDNSCAGLHTHKDYWAGFVAESIRHWFERPKMPHLKH